MKVAILSNYINHHQIPLAEAFNSMPNVSFYFIETTRMSNERKKLGYAENENLTYLYHTYKPDEYDACQRVIDDADVLIVGSSPETLIKNRIHQNKLIFRYSERPLKNGIEVPKYIPRFIKWHLNNPKEKPIYLLCASGYTACDYHRFGLFNGKCYKWGYFPETIQYPETSALFYKRTVPEILWVGRFLDWKHPEMPIRAVSFLSELGICVHLNMIGIGPMQDELQRAVKEAGLEAVITFCGSMSTEKVRRYMEQADIFLFTSDFHEGWGAVLNEAMNSACAVIVSHSVGAVPFLIKHRVNGMVFPSGNQAKLNECLLELISDHNQIVRMGTAAYETIINEWNANIAASRLLALSDAILSGAPDANLYSTGPCSVAEIYTNHWFC